MMASVQASEKEEHLHRFKLLYRLVLFPATQKSGLCILQSI